MLFLSFKGGSDITKSHNYIWRNTRNTGHLERTVISRKIFKDEIIFITELLFYDRVFGPDLSYLRSLTGIFVYKTLTKEFDTPVLLPGVSTDVGVEVLDTFRMKYIDFSETSTLIRFTKLYPSYET